jgi:endonuclease/exonuclease/phosphatase family metal-dependent hydrolase
MSEIIVNQIQDKSNVILGGDFNLLSTTQTVQNIERHLTSVFKKELPTTFNVKHKNLEKSPGYATSAVDMMFVSPDLKIVSKSCPDVDVSDHFPLVCEVTLKDS